MVVLRLSKLLQEKNMTGQDLVKLGMGRGTVAHLFGVEKMKNQNSHISFKVIDQLCSILNCSPGEIFELTNE